MGKESKFRFLKPKKGCAFWREILKRVISQIHKIIEIHYLSGFGKGIEEKNVFDKWFSVQKLYTISDLLTEPYQWRRHYADLTKTTPGVKCFKSLCRTTSLEVKLYF